MLFCCFLSILGTELSLWIMIFTELVNNACYHAQNKPKYGLINQAEDSDNQKTHSERILVENCPVSRFFGRESAEIGG